MGAPQLAVAALLRRADGRILAVRAAQGPHSGRWSLPLRAVATYELAEDAVTALVRDQLHLQPGAVAFADTLTLSNAGVEVVANVFECTGWRGEPQYRASDFADAAWVDPAGPGAIDLAAEVRGLFAATDAGEDGRPARDPAALLAVLDEARTALLAAATAAEAVDAAAAADSLASAAGFEAYVTGETRRLLHIPGHTWRPFNSDQATADRRARPRPAPSDARQALASARMETSLWVRSLTSDQLMAFGNHAGRGAVRLGELLLEIADHDRAAALRLSPGATLELASTEGGSDAPAAR